jgi:hypothetical protein
MVNRILIVSLAAYFGAMGAQPVARRIPAPPDDAGRERDAGAVVAAHRGAVERGPTRRLVQVAKGWHGGGGERISIPVAGGLGGLYTGQTGLAGVTAQAGKFFGNAGGGIAGRVHCSIIAKGRLERSGPAAVVVGQVGRWRCAMKLR